MQMEHREYPLKVLLVDQNAWRSTLLEQHLTKAGYEVVGYLLKSEKLIAAVRALQPDVIIIDVDAPNRDTLEHIVVSGRDESRPIVMFTHDGDTEKIRSSTRAGVSAYVVGGLQSERIRPIIDAAMIPFEEYRVVKKQLETVTLKLSERQYVDRAKDLLMQQKHLSEQDRKSVV